MTLSLIGLALKSFADKLKILGRLMDYLWLGVLVLNDFFRTFVRGVGQRLLKKWTEYSKLAMTIHVRRTPSKQSPSPYHSSLGPSYLVISFFDILGSASSIS